MDGNVYLNDKKFKELPFKFGKINGWFNLGGSKNLTSLKNCPDYVGALLGFLWYNSNPAEVFMGDSGSLPIGGLMGFLAVVSKSEILLILLGFVFVLETLSVIIQIASYKSRGKRVFLMAPLHHHFEMKKWAENKIIVRFWIVALLSNIIALLTIKIR